METNNTPANVANLLTAAAYVRNETIINGNQAAQLDAMIGQIKDLTTKIEAVPAKIADLAAQGKEKAVAMWKRMAARYQAQFADAVANLRDWLVDFKANRPSVQINLDEPEESETPNPNNTPATMNTTETKTMYTDYKTAVHWCNNALIMCNNIPQIDPSVIDNARFDWYDEETETETEVFQWFITDCSQWDVEYLEEHFPGLLFTYSDLLDCFILCVDHFGTAWVSVRIETTLPNAAKENI